MSIYLDKNISGSEPNLRSLKPTSSGDVTVPAYRAHLAQANEQQTTICYLPKYTP